MKTFNKNLILTVFAFCCTLGFSGPAMAATTPNLGAAANFGVLANTYTNNTVGLGVINGDLGYTTLSIDYGTLNGSAYIGGGLGNATYSAAGTAQGIALAALSAGVNLGCTFPFAAGAIDLATDTTHGATGVYESGVYCTTTAAGAMSIGTTGITLSGAGTYIFRTSAPSNALTTVAGAEVRLTNGASACDVFWTPTSATTLAANTKFVGTVISPAITVGANTIWTGRALAFGYTVTTDTDIITVPTGCSPASATLHVIKSVNNAGGGTAVPSDFTVNVYSGGVFYTGTLGTGTPGTSYAGLSAGTYTVSDVSASYTQSFSGDCIGGSVTLLAGNVKVCTIINTYIIPPSGGGGGGSTLLKDTCSNGDYSSSYYDGICGTAPAVATGTNSVITTGSVVTSGAVVVTGTVVIVETNIPTTGVVIPGLPKTGFYIEDSKTPLSIIIFVSGFMMLSIAFIVVLRKYNI